jgi:hypothetical protein
LFCDSYVYEHVRGIESFDPWLARIDDLTRAAFEECAQGIPEEWFDSNRAAFSQMLERLWSRRNRVRALIVAAIRESPNIFPSWHGDAGNFPESAGSFASHTSAHRFRIRETA